ncbi:MAG TPA: hypothetical protein VFN25_15160 [Dokdonella sp.]|uniref:hypothetical protein n=1 Tax=Dokdonella sp. TaxID=2291710 RepID=UPI002D7E82AB|nr:hypothetical protein [Dokdonella sp.]HET9034229.1 hypothetical protein [Dokdonella sp.]
MNVTILFGDRERKSSVDQIALRAREVVDAVLTRARENQESSTAGPVWHSVAMQISCREEDEYLKLLAAIERKCVERRINVMGVRCA